MEEDLFVAVHIYNATIGFKKHCFFRTFYGELGAEFKYYSIND